MYVYKNCKSIRPIATLLQTNECNKFLWNWHYCISCKKFLYLGKMNIFPSWLFQNLHGTSNAHRFPIHSFLDWVLIKLVLVWTCVLFACEWMLKSTNLTHIKCASHTGQQRYWPKSVDHRTPIWFDDFVFYLLEDYILFGKWVWFAFFHPLSYPQHG
jgi:hypothetical protein